MIFPSYGLTCVSRGHCGKIAAGRPVGLVGLIGGLGRWPVGRSWAWVLVDGRLSGSRLGGVDKSDLPPTGLRLAGVELLTWSQLVHRVGGRKVAEGLLAEGGWWRVVRGAYAPVDVADSLATRAAALRLVLPSDVAASHRTALWLLGLDVLGLCLEVTAPRGRHLRDRAGLTVSSAALPDDELVLVDGALAVSAARAFVDVASDDSLIEAVAIGDCVLRSGAATIDQLLAALDRAGGLRGIKGAREVVPHLESRSESLMESRFRMRLVLGGVPRPEAQWDVYTDDGHVGRSDWHLDGVVLEYDGRASRLSPVAFTQERRRQTSTAETGLGGRRMGEKHFNPVLE